MNIKLITEIVNDRTNSEDEKRSLIIGVLARDKNAMPDILELLAEERKNKNELIIDFNLELSRANIYIDERPESKDEIKNRFNKQFVTDEIRKFYIKYKDFIRNPYIKM